MAVKSSVRWAVFRRDGFRCQYCGRKGQEDGVVLEPDHIIPRALGGRDDADNLKTSCRECNAGKSDELPAYEYPFPDDFIIACPTRWRYAIVAAMAQMSYPDALALAKKSEPDFQFPPHLDGDDALVREVGDSSVAALIAMVQKIHGPVFGVVDSPIEWFRPIEGMTLEEAMAAA